VKYTVVSEFDHQEFLEKVDNLVKLGWKPQGGISVTSWIYNDPNEFVPDVTILYSQALILTI